MKETLKMICWDVQHGNAMLIKTPDDKTIVVDLGRGSYISNDQKFSPIKHAKIKKIDLLIITHPHRDHIEDILSLNGIEVSSIILPSHLRKKDFYPEDIRTSDMPIFDKYWKLSKSSDAMNNRRFGRVHFSFFCHVQGGANLNNHSVVTIMTYLNHRVVLMGDNERSSQKFLLDNDRFHRASKHCDVLLAPHHGRKSGFLKGMVDHLNPKITIVSDGRIKETSVRTKYSQASSGLKVDHNGRNRRDRNALSTNRDGVIIVEIGTYRNNPRMRVSTKSSKA